MPRVHRRTVLIGGLAAVALPAGLLASQAAAARATIVVKYLRDQLPGLAVSQTDLQGFASEYLERNVSGGGHKVRYEAIFLILANPMLAAAAPSSARIAHEDFTRGLLTKFLMSTDFFGAAEQRPERTSYIAFNDPYDFGCSNPIARFELET